MRRDSLWFHRDFRSLWAGDTISQFGASVGYLALALVAAGALGATPFQMGVLTAADTAAFLVIGLPAGAWVDRMRRRPLMLRADLGRALLLLTVPVAWWAGVLTLTHLLVVALLTGVLTVFFEVAYQSYLPSLVGREHLVEGNAKLQASQSVAQVSGPALGGGLAQLLGAANSVLVTGLGYLASAFFLWRIKAEEPAPELPDHVSLWAEVGEGLRFVLRHRLLRAIAGCTATLNFFGAMGMALNVLFLTRELGLSAGLAGTVLAGYGLGGVVGAVTASRWHRRVGQARTIWLVILVTQPLALLTPLSHRGWSVALFVISSFAISYGGIVYNVAQVSFRQAITPPRLLGRMNASVRFLVWGTIPVGSVIGGLIGEWLGVRGALWVAAFGGLLGVLWVLCSPLRGMRDLPSAHGMPAEVAAR